MASVKIPYTYTNYPFSPKATKYSKKLAQTQPEQVAAYHLQLAKSKEAPKNNINREEITFLAVFFI